MTQLPSRRHRRHANPFSLRGPVATPDYNALFGRQAPLAIDVGCGSGQFTCELALARPGYNVLGIEMRNHLVRDTEARARSARAVHVRALRLNASTQLPEILPPRSVRFVAINFPDPWYKKRHHKRRVVQLAWVRALQPALMPAAEISAMTDYLPLALHMRAVFDAVTELVDADRGALADIPSTSADDVWAPNHRHGATSERENHHIARREPIYRMHYVYRHHATDTSGSSRCAPGQKI